MYTLKIENPPQDFVLLVQSFVQENRLWIYDADFNTIEVCTKSVKDLKRLVDVLDSEKFVEQDFSDYIRSKYT
jgi:hypothetical protein